MSRNNQQAQYQSQKGQVVAALAGGIAHDFNNILAAVICQIELALLAPDLPPAARESLTKALQSAKRGAELNAKLLQFSRHTERRPIAVNPARLLEETIFLLRRAVDRKIQIRFESPETPPWSTLADEGQLMQALMNLCLNARDAMSKGGELTLRLANRQFNAEQIKPPQHAGEFIQISVCDTGQGMTPEVLNRLFEPYFTTKEFGKGSGLGLSIANHVIVEHGGWMEVESEPNQGSRFHVFLPRITTTAETTPDLVEPYFTGGTTLDGHETILLVDDEQPLREVIQAMLAFRGYQVITASDGAEALEQFLSAKGTIDVVLMDIQMPRMNGWEAMKKIHALNPRIPVLLLSGGVSDPPDDGKAPSKAAAIMLKPFTSSELLRTVRKALDTD